MVESGEKFTRWIRYWSELEEKAAHWECGSTELVRYGMPLMMRNRWMTGPQPTATTASSLETARHVAVDVGRPPIPISVLCPPWSKQSSLDVLSDKTTTA